MHLLDNPTVTVNRAMDLLGITYVRAYGLIAALVDVSILQEMTDCQRNRIFILKRYIDIFRDGNLKKRILVIVLSHKNIIW